MEARYRGLIVAAGLSLVGILLITLWVGGFGTELTAAGVEFTGFSLFLCAVIGLVVTGLLIWVTEYYTGTQYRPVQSIAQASTTGHGTNVIQGLAISMEATAIPALIICVAIIATYGLAGLFGIGRKSTRLNSNH